MQKYPELSGSAVGGSRAEISTSTLVTSCYELDCEFRNDWDWCDGIIRNDPRSPCIRPTFRAQNRKRKPVTSLKLLRILYVVWAQTKLSNHHNTIRQTNRSNYYSKCYEWSGSIMYLKKMILLFCTGEACWHETQLSRESTFTLMVDFNFALNIQTQIYILSTETLINREYRTYQSERQRSKAFFKIINTIFNISR